MEHRRSQKAQIIFLQRNQDSNNFIQFIKIGSACLFNSKGELNYEVLKKKANEIENDTNQNVLIVSGAIAMGRYSEEETRNKDQLSSTELQGYASLGQKILMDFYGKLFKKNICQILVTEKELKQTEEIRNLIIENLKKGRLTLINYNDSIDFEEIKKDNDTLAAEIMLSCKGDRLIILGHDYDGLKNGSGELVERVYEINNEVYSYCNGKSKHGNGGFKTKLDAAKTILSQDKELIISNVNSNLEEIINGTAKRTLFKR
ncbi:MAG: hypothetical protein WCI72_00505 [archaeon]